MGYHRGGQMDSAPDSPEGVEEKCSCGSDNPQHEIHGSHYCSDCVDSLYDTVMRIRAAPSAEPDRSADRDFDREIHEKDSFRFSIDGGRSHIRVMRYNKTTRWAMVDLSAQAGMRPLNPLEHSMLDKVAKQESDIERLWLAVELLNYEGDTERVSEILRNIPRR